ncbi:ROK family transcriptional regulator [Agromyces neolithicus]|uniref:ROK family transcriptional regulator n=2 Tax=Agromyces neolithicus TaxID=269420 RepID=A0ABN2M3X8_9MICO
MPSDRHASLMTEVGETSAPTHTGPIDDAHRAQAARLLEHLIVHGPATRSELSTATGLGRGAIAGLTARLLEAGVIRANQADTSADGRTTPLALTASDHVLVTAMLARDEAIATVATLGGDEIARFVAPLVTPPTPALDDDDPDRATEALPTPAELLAAALSRALARADRAGHPIADVTVLVDGAVVGQPAVVITDARLGAEPVDLVSVLRGATPGLDDAEAALPLPLALQSTAAAAAHAERAELPGVDDVLFLSGDGAITAAVISDGRPLIGAHGLAATFAHLPVVQGGVRCDCGQTGCLATVAASGVVLERAGLAEFAAANGHAAALEELVARVDDGDDRARWSWLDAALWIGRALQVVVPTVDPTAVVIGGYWAPLLGDIEAAFRANRPTIGGGALRAIPTLAPARLGPDAALVGARRQARERLVADPLLLVG